MIEAINKQLLELGLKSERRKGYYTLPLFETVSARFCLNENKGSESIELQVGLVLQDIGEMLNEYIYWHWGKKSNKLTPNIYIYLDRLIPSNFIFCKPSIPPALVLAKASDVILILKTHVLPLLSELTTHNSIIEYLLKNRDRMYQDMRLALLLYNWNADPQSSIKLVSDTINYWVNQMDKDSLNLMKKYPYPGGVELWRILKNMNETPECITSYLAWKDFESKFCRHIENEYPSCFHYYPKAAPLRVGNIYCVEFKDAKRYFQYVGNDTYFLNATVIRVFLREYPLDYIPIMDEIVMDGIDFYAHTILTIWERVGHWTKVGHSKNIGDLSKIKFYNSLGLTETWTFQQNKVISEKSNRDLELEGYYDGVVVPASVIIKKMRRIPLSEKVSCISWIHPKFYETKCAKDFIYQESKSPIPQIKTE